MKEPAKFIRGQLDSLEKEIILTADGYTEANHFIHILKNAKINSRNTTY